jgi:hypothetical protein
MDEVLDTVVAADHAEAARHVVPINDAAEWRVGHAGKS